MRNFNNGIFVNEIVVLDIDVKVRGITSGLIF